MARKSNSDIVLHTIIAVFKGIGNTIKKIGGKLFGRKKTLDNINKLSTDELRELSKDEIERKQLVDKLKEEGLLKEEN